MSKKCIRATVHGRVQGVSFRYHTRKTATKLQLTGWVRNESNGTVSVVAEGEKPKLEELVEFLHEGPSFARVENVEVEWTEAEGAFQNFKVTG